MATAAAETLQALRRDPLLAAFVDGDDAADTTAFTSRALGSSSAATATHALAEGIQQLELALRSEVVSKHTELLQNLTRRGNQALQPPNCVSAGCSRGDKTRVDAAWVRGCSPAVVCRRARAACKSQTAR